MPEEITPSAEDMRDLEIARGLIAAGVAVFAAPPCPPGCTMTDRKGRVHKGGPGKYHAPRRWEDTVPSQANIDRWKPGWALGLVGGRVVDGLDEDPRSGGDISIGELHAAGHMPMTFGEQQTASGGRHYLIAATGERKEVSFMPGLDLQAGEAGTGKGGGEKLGKGFIWIAPTVRPSKDPANLGELVRYRWTTPPDMEALEEYGETARESTEGIVSRIHAARLARKNKPRESAPAAAPADPNDPFTDSSTANAGPGAGPGSFGERREFTLAEAQEFVRPHLVALQQARIGQIEERCNTAAAVLSHFVPAFWSAGVAMTILETNLAETAYDPNGPSDWDVSKFEDVLDGTRPPADDWKAVVRQEPAAAPIAAVDVEPGEEMLSTLDRLRAKLVTAEELALRPAPEPLVWGLLNRSTEAWMIGAPGSLKSFVALDLAGAVAAGREWHGHRTEQADVLYVAAEGEHGMVLRARAYVKRHGGMPGVTLLPYPVQIKSADGQWQALEQIAREGGYGLIVIDTQHRVSTGLEENSATDMGTMVAAVGRLKRAAGACVLVVHHTGRNGGDARGSSAIDGAQDTELKIVRATDGKRPALQCKVIQDKQKDMAQDTGEPLTLDFAVVDLGQDSHGRPLSSLVVAGVADPFTKVQGFTDDELEPWKGKDTEPWTKHVPGVQPNARVQRYILQVLADHAHSIGLTEAQAKKAVIARWYPDLGQKKTSKGLDDDNWINAWRVVASTDLAENIGGERWALDQVILTAIKEAHPL